VKVFLACVALALTTVGCNSDNSNPTDPSQVSIEFTLSDLVVGTGAQAAVGNAVTVNYSGWLYNAQGTDSKGVEFDSSLRPGRSPLGPFTLGARSLLVGFEQAVVGMRVGGKRRAYLPASLAYGSQGNANIPPNAALVFEIDLLTVQ
jgi:FKBP-type peptidyl-prolyl cis-trans isomerase FkpA